MNKQVLTVLICGAISAPVFAAPETYTIDSSHTFPTFEVSHLGFSTHRGRFNNTSGQIVIDSAAKSGSIEVKIDTASVDTGGEKLETHLRAEDFFNVEKFPAMTFKSNKLNFNGDTLVAAQGELTLLGISKPVTLTIASFKCGNHPVNKKAMCGAEASATIKRSDFGMKYGVPAVGDEVKLNIQVEAYKN